MIEDNKNNPLTDFSDQIRAVEALLFAAADPLDEKTLREMLPDDIDIEQIMNNLLNLYKGRGVELKRINNKWMFKTASDLSFIMQREAKIQKKIIKSCIRNIINNCLSSACCKS